MVKPAPFELSRIEVGMVCEQLFISVQVNPFFLCEIDHDISEDWVWCVSTFFPKDDRPFIYANDFSKLSLSEVKFFSEFFNLFR